MKIYYNFENTKLKNTVLTIGTFDGVHKGHQKIITALKNESLTENALLTFDPHPRKILFPNEISPKLLTTLEEKIELLELNGVNNLIICKFDVNFSKLTAGEFIKNYLIEKLSVRTLIMGYDHTIGSDRLSNPLKELTTPLPYQLIIKKIGPLEVDDVNISSTKIRNFIIAGEIEKANSFLGYNYNITGKVVPGNQIGRKIGFPTANIQVKNQDKLLPGPGVYKVSVKVDNQTYSAMLNIGTRPTFYADSNSIIEVHLINQTLNLYDKTLKISFEKFIREEIKFDGIEELKAQLKKDKEKIMGA